MLFEELIELHYIAHFDNVASIVSNGILPYNKVKHIRHTSFAMEEIQERRENVIIPGASKLHDYANLYINARNTALYKRREMHDQMCIFRVNKDILKLPGVVIADRNASSDFVRWYSSPEGLEKIDKDIVFAKYWTHRGNEIQENYHRSCMCAEVLVPRRVDPKYLVGIYCSCAGAKAHCSQIVKTLDITVNSYMFFL